jgi:hypothetical protein
MVPNYLFLLSSAVWIQNKREFNISINS